MTFTEQQINEAIKCPYQNYTNNLRDRSPKLQRDCFTRGTLAEIFFSDFFKQYGFIVQSNIVNDYRDIDLQISGVTLSNQIIHFDSPIRLEIKTSLKPYQNFDIYQSADLKIYKNNNSIECDINWDIGIQVYFNKFKKDWENFIEQSDDTTIFNEYINLDFFCSWILRDKAISYSNNIHDMNGRIWDYCNKVFWKCPLNIHNHNIYEMVIYLLNLLVYQQQLHINNLNTYIGQIKGNNV